MFPVYQEDIEDEIEIFNCDHPLCKFSTEEKLAIMRHHRTCEFARPFKCRECGFRAAEEDHIRVHELEVHSVDKVRLISAPDMGLGPGNGTMNLDSDDESMLDDAFGEIHEISIVDSDDSDEEKKKKKKKKKKKVSFYFFVHIYKLIFFCILQTNSHFFLHSFIFTCHSLIQKKKKKKKKKSKEKEEEEEITLHHSDDDEDMFGEITLHHSDDENEEENKKIEQHKDPKQVQLLKEQVENGIMDSETYKEELEALPNIDGDGGDDSNGDDAKETKEEIPLEMLESKKEPKKISELQESLTLGVIDATVYREEVEALPDYDEKEEQKKKEKEMEIEKEKEKEQKEQAEKILDIGTAVDLGLSDTDSDGEDMFADSDVEDGDEEHHLVLHELRVKLHQVINKKGKVKKFFKKLDADANGSLSKEEMLPFLKSLLGKPELNETDKEFSFLWVHLCDLGHATEVTMSAMVMWWLEGTHEPGTDEHKDAQEAALEHHEAPSDEVANAKVKAQAKQEADLTASKVKARNKLFSAGNKTKASNSFSKAKSTQEGLNDMLGDLDGDIGSSSEDDDDDDDDDDSSSEEEDDLFGGMEL